MIQYINKRKDPETKWTKWKQWEMPQTVKHTQKERERDSDTKTVAVTNEKFITILQTVFGFGRMTIYLTLHLQFNRLWTKRISLKTSLSTFGFAFYIVHVLYAVSFYTKSTNENRNETKITTTKGWKWKKRSHHPASISYQMHESSLWYCWAIVVEKEINFTLSFFFSQLQFLCCVRVIGVCLIKSLAEVEINVIAFENRATAMMTKWNEAQVQSLK